MHMHSDVPKMVIHQRTSTNVILLTMLLQANLLEFSWCFPKARLEAPHLQQFWIHLWSFLQDENMLLDTFSCLSQLPARRQQSKNLGRQHPARRKKDWWADSKDVREVCGHKRCLQHLDARRYKLWCSMAECHLSQRNWEVAFADL